MVPAERLELSWAKARGILSPKIRKNGGHATAENCLKNSNYQIVASICPVGWSWLKLGGI